MFQIGFVYCFIPKTSSTRGKIETTNQLNPVGIFSFSLRGLLGQAVGWPQVSSLLPRPWYSYLPQSLSRTGLSSALSTARRLPPKSAHSSDRSWSRSSIYSSSLTYHFERLCRICIHGADPAQETCPRSSRLYDSHPTTRELYPTDHTDQGPIYIYIYIFPERSTLPVDDLSEV